MSFPKSCLPSPLPQLWLSSLCCGIVTTGPSRSVATNQKSGLSHRKCHLYLSHSAGDTVAEALGRVGAGIPLNGAPSLWSPWLCALLLHCQAGSDPDEGCVRDGGRGNHSPGGTPPPQRRTCIRGGGGSWSRDSERLRKDQCFPARQGACLLAGPWSTQPLCFWGHCRRGGPGGGSRDPGFLMSVRVPDKGGGISPAAHGGHISHSSICSKAVP